jgi:hypothetical protein
VARDLNAVCDQSDRECDRIDRTYSDEGEDVGPTGGAAQPRFGGVDSNGISDPLRPGKGLPS